MENPFEKEYSDPSFWEKVKQFARTAGESVLEPALKMYYAAQDPSTPAWAKAVIYGALGYFISLIDAVPDLTPIIGFTDDLGVLVAALATVAIYVKDSHKQKASETMKKWFKDED